MAELSIEWNEMPETAESWLGRVLGLDRTGTLLCAVDAAEQVLKNFLDDIGLKQHAILILS